MIQTETIDKALKEHGYSRRSMARELDIHPATFNQWMLGNNPMPDRVVYILCEKLGLSPVQIDPDLDAAIIFKTARKDAEAKYRVTKEAEDLGLHIVETQPLSELARLMRLRVRAKDDRALFRAIQLVEELAKNAE